jgi:hypothetical protein
MSPYLFHPAEPFPLESMSYRDAQAHSEQVDGWLGLRIREVERKLLEGRGKSKSREQENWIGLAPQTLLTPYTELRAMLSFVNPLEGSKAVDLGAGYGRLGFVLARHYPMVDFIGYEVVEERVLEARRCLENHKCSKAVMFCEDLSAPDFVPASADSYFIYDYGSRSAVVKTLNDLRLIAQTRPITVIGRGRLSRDLIELETPWLSQVNPSSHHGNFSIYRS